VLDQVGRHFAALEWTAFTVPASRRRELVALCLGALVRARVAETRQQVGVIRVEQPLGADEPSFDAEREFGTADAAAESGRKFKVKLSRCFSLKYKTPLRSCAVPSGMRLEFGVVRSPVT